MNARRRTTFVATILLGSFLLFLVQPMVARMAVSSAFTFSTWAVRSATDFSSRSRSLFSEEARAEERRKS